MKQLIGRTMWTAVLTALAVTGAVAPASAQQAGERLSILVPNLAPQDGISDRFGQRVADQLREAIADMQRHQAVSEDDLEDALDKYELDEEDLFNCIRARQLAMQMGWGLVVCGQYSRAGGDQLAVNASFVGSQDGATFDVPEFTISERAHEQAAQQLLQTFERYETQLRRTLFCQQYMDSQQWEQALENCNQALAINPDAEGANYRKGYILWEMDRPQEALQAFEKVLEIDPIDQDALKMAGIIATEMENKEQARTYFDRYMELNPGDVSVRLTLATEMANAGDPEGALRFAEAGLESEPDNLNLKTYIGHFAANAAAQAESRMQNPEAEAQLDPATVTEFYTTAADMYEDVFETKGDSTEAAILEKLIISKFKLGDIEEAVSLGERATQARADNPAIWEAYSRALEEAGQTQEALVAIEQAQQLGAQSPTLTQRKAMIQLKAGNTAEGVAALNESVEAGQLDPSKAFNIIFGHAYQEKFQKGQLDAAYQMLEEAGPLAVAEADKLTRNFWRGYIRYQQALKIEEPKTAASARQAKPLFERALELFQAARGYEELHASANVPKLIEATQQYIEIQDALIKRGR